MSTTLALDCSFAGLTLALRSMETGQTWSFTTTTPRSSDILPLELHNLFETSGTSAANLQTVFATVGPGSFTGARLGLATAQALKLANPAITVTGLSTLQALAVQVAEDLHPTQPVTLFLDAAGSQAYTQTFNPAAQPLAPAACLLLAEALANTPAHHHLAAQTSLLLPRAHHPLESLTPAALFAAAQNPAFHLPPEPLYLKQLTYRHA